MHPSNHFGHMNRPAKTDTADFVRDHSRPQLPAQMWRTLSQVVLYFSASQQRWIIGIDTFWPQLTFFPLQRVLIERRDERQFNHGFVPNCYVLYKTQTAYSCGTKVWELLVYEQVFFFIFFFMWFVIPYWKVQSYMHCVTKPHEKWGEPVVLLRTAFPSRPLLCGPGLFQKGRKAHGHSQLSRLVHLFGNITHHQLSRCYWQVQPIGRNCFIKGTWAFVTMTTMLGFHCISKHKIAKLTFHLFPFVSPFIFSPGYVQSSLARIVAKSLKVYTSPPHAYVMDVISIWEKKNVRIYINIYIFVSLYIVDF